MSSERRGRRSVRIVELKRCNFGRTLTVPGDTLRSVN